jgi:cytochrome P450
MSVLLHDAQIAAAVPRCRRSNLSADPAGRRVVAGDAAERVRRPRLRYDLATFPPRKGETLGASTDSKLPLPPAVSRRFPGQLMLEFFRDRLVVLQAIAREQGGVAQFTLWPVHFYVISEPPLIEELLTEHRHKLAQGLPIVSAKRLFGSGLIAAEWDLHDRQRPLLEPAFADPRVATHADAIVNCATRERWHDGQVIDVHEEMRRVCVGVAGVVLLDHNLEARAPELSRAMTEIMRGIDLLNLPVGRLLDRFPVPPTLRFRRALRLVSEVVDEMIAGARSTEARGGLLADVVREGRMSPQQLHDEVTVALFATYILNATALSWAWYLLAENRDAENRLHAELDGVLHGELPTAPDVERLPYTAMVVTEALRLYPPIFALVRRLIEDVELGGYQLRAGTQMFLPQWVVHRDSRWYPEPDRFRPERWEAPEADHHPSGRYFPFGYGPRTCIGAPLAWFEQPLLIATIAREWRFDLVPGHRVRRQPWLALYPKDGVRMRVERRRQAST